MNSLSFAILLVVAAVAMGGKPWYDLNDAPALFEKFIKDYNREYKDEADKQVHFEEFKKTLQLINESNAKSTSATFDINAFADYTLVQKKHLLGVLFRNKPGVSTFS